MAHLIYTTPAFLLRSRPSREDSRVLTLYTRELGLVEAYAQGVRKLKSKLRPHLSELSLARVSLVRGREFWRLTSAENLTNFGDCKPGKVLLVSRIFSLILKLVNGELAHPELFDELEKALVFLTESNLDPRSLHHFEIVMVLKVLYHLGYLGQASNLEQFFLSPDWTLEFLESVGPLRRQALASINQSFEQSQL